MGESSVAQPRMLFEVYFFSLCLCAESQDRKKPAYLVRFLESNFVIMLLFQRLFLVSHAGKKCVTSHQAILRKSSDDLGKSQRSLIVNFFHCLLKYVRSPRGTSRCTFQPYRNLQFVVFCWVRWLHLRTGFYWYIQRSNRSNNSYPQWDKSQY